MHAVIGHMRRFRCSGSWLRIMRHFWRSARGWENRLTRFVKKQLNWKLACSLVIQDLRKREHVMCEGGGLSPLYFCLRLASLNFAPVALLSPQRFKKLLIAISSCGAISSFALDFLRAEWRSIVSQVLIQGLAVLISLSESCCLR